MARGEIEADYQRGENSVGVQLKSVSMRYLPREFAKKNSF